MVLYVPTTCLSRVREVRGGGDGGGGVTEVVVVAVWKERSPASVKDERE